MNDVHPYKLKPMARLFWNAKHTKDYWEERIKKAQKLVESARFEAFKRGILKTSTIYIPHGVNPESALYLHNEIGKLKLKIGVIPTDHRPYKAFIVNGNKGYLYLYTNSDELSIVDEQIYKDWDLYLSLGYFEANEENRVWYSNMRKHGIIDPTAEMEDQDKVNFYLNPYLRHLGLSILPYIPRSWDDEYSLELAKKIIDIMKELDGETTKDLITLLEMPTRYNTWRGLADIDTPIFKTHTDTTAYVKKIVVDYEVHMSHYKRNSIPGAVYGTRFPWISKKEERELREIQNGDS